MDRTQRPCTQPAQARVLFASHTANVGCGAENVLISLVTALGAAGVHPVVVVPEGGGPMEEVLAHAGVEVRRSPLRWWIGNPGQLAEFGGDWDARVVSMCGLLRELAPDVVVTNTCVIKEAAAAARLLNLPHVWYVHEMLSRDASLKALQGPEAAYRDIASLSQTVLCVSHAVREEILQTTPAASSLCRFEVIHTGINPLGWEDHSAARRLLLERTGFCGQDVIACFVGVLSQRKGVLALVDAAQQLQHKAPNLRFALVGPDGGEEAALRAALERFGLQGRVALLGHSDTPLPLMQGADIVVLPSLADPFPLVAHEAMHLGKPLVATASGGVQEIVEEGVTGYLVPVGDIAAMADRLCALAKDKALRQRMGQAGLTRVRSRFDLQTYVSRVGALLVATATRRALD